jgi:citrate lyase subunit beta / citryl-CoA lyase
VTQSPREQEVPPALRSMIFTPGNRPDMITKAAASGADAVIVDLEDAVPAGAKVRARGSLQDLPSSEVPWYVRVNGAGTGHLWDDVIAAGLGRAAGIVLPKAHDPDLLGQLDGALTVLERQAGRRPGSIEIIPLIESAAGVLSARDMFESTRRVQTVLFGSGEQGDLVTDLGCEWTPDGTALLTARSLVVLAARAVGVQPIDAVFMDFRNLDALRVECHLARRTGYVGKVAIHPAQLPVIHEVFTPSPEEVAGQRRIIELFDQAVAAGSASIDVDGRMVDYAVAARARSVLARARAVPGQ